MLTWWPDQSVNDKKCNDVVAEDKKNVYYQIILNVLKGHSICQPKFHSVMNWINVSFYGKFWKDVKVESYMSSIRDNLTDHE